MKLFEQMIKKRLELYEEFMINRNYLRAIWVFYQGYALSLLVLNEQDPELPKKNLLWKKNMKKMESFDSKQLKALIKYVSIDISTIIRALNKIQLGKGLDGGVFGDHYKKLTIGIMSYEYPEDLG